MGHGVIKEAGPRCPNGEPHRDLKPVAHVAIFSLATFVWQSVKSTKNGRGKEVGENWEVAPEN